ncbi:snakin-2-like [Magnolia sinica]|uniref:snakin-2-like n=1 Tax=Magnolia sinica TaxID=86752 RepID=UPI00265B54B3|nr:snakin-2-like [Magnolia sinica]
MALKAIIFVLASFLLVTSRGSSNNEDNYMEVASASVLATAPVHAPAPAPLALLPPVKVTECPRLCVDRCKLNSRPRHCKRVCGTCCQRCKCVPPGTAGNRELCGKCYTDMTTHGNRTKCP